MEIVRQMKESACYVIFNPQREDAHTLDKSGAGGLPYQLPDGTQIMVGDINCQHTNFCRLLFFFLDR